MGVSSRWQWYLANIRTQEVGSCSTAEQCFRKAQVVGSNPIPVLETRRLGSDMLRTWQPFGEQAELSTPSVLGSET